MSRIWKISPRKSEDLIEQLLLNRGLKTRKDREDFFHPALKNYSKEIQIDGIPKALKRIRQAIERGEQVIIYGDYDVDGICSSAILYKALTSLGAKVLPYIPHREKEGYGLSRVGLEFARDSGAGLVITVDNGIVALEQAKIAAELGLDLIITDHHLPLDKKPKALAIVHSTLMCGAGVAWCLIQSQISDSLRKELLQFVAIATITDLIPLTGVARAFVAEGIEELNRTKNLGLLALIGETSLKVGAIGSFEIGFVLGPRLNAIGRLEHAIDALRLLCTSDPLKAKRLANLLCETNSARQRLTTDALEQAKLMIDPKEEKSIHILESRDWIPGIIGLIAGRISEEYGKPAVAISIGEGISKGSARSPNGTNIVEVIRSCSDILVDVGGHKGAAGFTIRNEHLAEFKLKLEQEMDRLPDGHEPFLAVEAEVESRALTKALARKLQRFAPFGYGNPEPLLVTRVMKVSDIRLLSEGKHLKFKSDGIDAIAFGMGQLSALLKEGQLVDMAFYLQINRFNGMETLQLKVKDLKW